MATQTIHGYAAASTIDATADYLLIDPASTGNYKKINRNVILGITGSPLGTTDTQNISAKTLGNTNTITVKDTLLTLQNASDVTKQANFSLAGVTTGTTRTYTLPNASVTLASLTGTETLTNKTITGATISGGSIDNATITVDAITGHTTSTIVTVGGVQMSNGIVATTGAVNTNSILAGAVVPNSLQASSGSGWAGASYTPTLTSITIGTGGNAQNTAKYVQIGKNVFMRGYIVLGTSGASVGAGPTISLPVTAATSSGYNVTVAPIGKVIIIDNATNQYPGIVYLSSSTTAQFMNQNSASTSLIIATTTATVPFTFGQDDGFLYELSYEAA